MKQVFFYSNHREDDPSIGITKKVHAQIAELRRRGWVVTYSAYCRGGVSIYDPNGREIKHYPYPFHGSQAGRFFRRNLLLNKCGAYLTEHPVDLVYMRFHFWDAVSVRFLKNAKKSGAKVVVEAHSYPYCIRGGFLRNPYFLLDRFFQKDVSKYIDLVAAVTTLRERVWNCETVQIENGVNAEDTRTRTAQRNEDGVIRLLCVGNETRSHGMERLLRSFAACPEKERFFIWLVGEYSEKTKKTVAELGLSDRVRLEGKKCGAELYHYYNQADLGIGPLAGYLLNVDSGTCLKTKEYLAVGLPFFTAADAHAEVASAPGALVIPNDDSPVDFSLIRSFAEMLRFDQKKAEEMHRFAVSHYAWSAQFDRIFSRLNIETP